MKHIDLSKLQIKTKKDWIIFWVFAALVSYALAGLYQNRIDNQLRRFQNPWMWTGNEPHGYGRMIVAVLILAVVAEVVCFLRHKNRWMKLIVPVVGILVPLALVGMYWYHCRLIVSVIWDEEPINMGIHWSDQTYYSLTGDEQAEVMALCRQMTVVSDKQKQQELMEWYQNKNKSVRGLDMLDLYFGEKYGHSVWFWVYVSEDAIYFNRGYGPNSKYQITFFEDDGLVQYIENLKKEQDAYGILMQ